MLMELANEFLVSVIDCIPTMTYMCIYIYVCVYIYWLQLVHACRILTIATTHINSVKYSYIATGIHACSWLATGI